MGILTVTRRIGEEVILKTSDGDIIVLVTKSPRFQARAGEIRLTFSAPDSVEIMRSELIAQGMPSPRRAEPMADRASHPATEIATRRQNRDPFLPAPVPVENVGDAGYCDDDKENAA